MSSMVTGPGLANSCSAAVRTRCRLRAASARSVMGSSLVDGASGSWQTKWTGCPLTAKGVPMYAVLLASALLVGCLLAVQTSANLQLTKAVGTPYGASTLQLTLAAVLLAVAALAVGALGAIRLDVPGWHLLGGLASPIYITSGILLFPRLGALASVGLFVTGQVIASLAIDLLGLFGIARHPSSAGILLGVVAVLAGITM